MSLLRAIFAVCAAFGIAACGGAPAPTATTAPTPLPPASPTLAPLPATPAPAPDRYAAIPQDNDMRGLPLLGFPSAPVVVEVYAAYDDPASAAFYSDGYQALVERARTGEVRIVFAPLYGRGGIAGGRGAARAALCAEESGAFWRYNDALFALVAAGGDDPLNGARLLDAVTAAGIPRAAWDACMLSDRPDARLETAASTAANTPNFTTTPFVRINRAPSLTDRASIEAGVQAELAQYNRELSTAVAEAATLALVTPTEAPLVITLEPVTGGGIAPPFTMGMPAGWSSGYDLLTLDDLDGIRQVPFAVYQGPVTGGRGTIVLLWAFPNMLTVSAAATTGIAPDLFIDGLRLLRLAVVETGCNIGTDLRRSYSIGGLAAVGTQFAAVGCPDGLPDTRGWFAGLRQENINYIFYVYTEPITAMDGAAASELQTILDTIRFRPLSSLPTAAAP